MWVDIEKKGQPSKWVTLRALRVLKAAYSEGLEEKKLTTAEKNKKEEIVKGMKGSFKGDKSAMYAIATAKAKKVAENIAKQLKND